jgi:HEPN domain-containing protein
MADPKILIAVIREWLEKADNDLLTAIHTLKLGALCPTDTVGFHAQQCVEKHINALLVFLAIPFSRTHDIRALSKLLPTKLRPSLDAKLKKQLTEYATVTRYPGSGTTITLTEARKAVAAARRVRREVRRHLPRAALRRGDK